MRAEPANWACGAAFRGIGCEAEIGMAFRTSSVILDSFVHRRPSGEIPILDLLTWE